MRSPFGRRVRDLFGITVVALAFSGNASAAASRVPRTAEELDEMIARGMTKASIARAGQKRAGSPSHS